LRRESLSELVIDCGERHVRLAPGGGGHARALLGRDPFVREDRRQRWGEALGERGEQIDGFTKEADEQGIEHVERDDSSILRRGGEGGQHLGVPGDEWGRIRHRRNLSRGNTVTRAG